MEDKAVQTVKPTKRSFIGIVTSDKMDKSEAKIGDTVKIVECKPFSKNKCWRLAEIIERAK